jgi:hypothetical protein
MFGFRQPAKPKPPEEQAPPPEPVVPVQAQGEPDEEYRQVLIDAIDLIDKTKRDIKAQIHSNAIRAKADRVSVDQVWLRRAKDKIDHLTREREEIRKALHTVNERIRDTHRAEHSQPKKDMGRIFMQVARETLPQDVYEGLLDEAAARMQNEG